MWRRDFAKGVEGFANVKNHPRPTGRYATELQGWIDLYLAFSGRTRDGRFDPLRDHNGSVTTEKGGRIPNHAQLCKEAMQTDIRAYLKLGDRAGLKVNVGQTGFNVTRNMCS